jgi:2-polyprenyl-6-methoxyphenol hydroxylase-like FAD-dependent oxidoreductase
MTSWDRLFGLLRKRWGEDGYHLGRELCGVVQNDDAVVANFIDRSELQADLLIGADGIRSGVRSQAMGAAQPLYAGYVGWRGMVDEADLPREVHAELFERFGFCLPPGEQMIGYPVAGDGHDLRPGYRRYNFVWYRPAEEATTLVDLLTDTNGVVHGSAIPPGKIRADNISAMRKAADEKLAPQFAAIIHATKAPFLQPIFDLDAEVIVNGRVALIGDAAFVARPHIGAGVTKACEDAVALAEALDQNGNVAEALHAYQRVRLPAGKRIVQRARDLGRSLQAHMVSDAEREAAILHHTPEAVMLENASMDF